MRVGWVVVVAAVAACGPGRPHAPGDGGLDTADGLVLTASFGSTNDGSGAAGLALLTSLRDPTGEGSSQVWNGEVRDSRGAVVASLAYGDGSPTRWAAHWWPAVPIIRGEGYQLILTNAAGHRHSVVGFSSAFSGLGSPAPRLTGTPSAIEWAPVMGAGSYRCDIDGSTGGLTTSTTCGVSELAAGGHQAAVVAFSADLQRLGTTIEVRPNLPISFDVSWSRLAWQQGASAAELHVVGGALRFGSSGRGLAIYTSLTAPGGSPSPLAWELEVTGPGLPSTAPLRFTVGAGIGRGVAWSYDVAPRVGTYLVRAVSGAASISLSFVVAEGAPLTEPSGVSATARGTGGADVSWVPVPGAVSYFVSAWNRSTGSFLSGKWVTGASAAFATDTFAAAVECNVFVAATNADLLAGSPPAALSVSENTFSPATFTSL